MQFAVRSLRMSAGAIVWALHFAAIYGITAIACARGFAGAVPSAVALASSAAVAITGWLIAAGWRRRAHFEDWLSATIAAFALIAIVFETIPIWLVPACV